MLQIFLFDFSPAVAPHLTLPLWLSRRGAGDGICSLVLGLAQGLMDQHFIQALQGG